MSQEENVRVYVRVRPPNTKEVTNGSRSVVNVVERKSVVCDGKGGQSTFSFDYCADDSVSQVNITKS